MDPMDPNGPIMVERYRLILDYLHDSYARYPWWPHEWHMDAVHQSFKWREDECIS